MPEFEHIIKGSKIYSIVDYKEKKQIKKITIKCQTILEKNLKKLTNYV
jgi:hypothetical protein